MRPDTRLSCLVIGAGPGGLACTKELIEAGLGDVICLESSDRIGGMFARGYDNLVLTSSAVFSMFSDFWIGPGPRHRFWTKAEAVAYWTAYADHFGVTPRIRFNARVRSLQQEPDGSWAVTLDSGDTLAADRVVLASSSNNTPRYPDWADQATDVEKIHSAHFRNADGLHGKRVLIVGGGESGSDIGLDIARVASATWLSLRGSAGWVVPRMRGAMAADTATHRGVWTLPRRYGAWLTRRILAFEARNPDPVAQAIVMLNRRITARNGIWGTYGTKSLGLPKAIAHHGCQVVGEITEVEEGGRRLTTAQGTVLADVDAILFATGYHSKVPYLPQPLQDMPPRRLFKQVFAPDIGDRLAWVGWARPCFGSQFPIMEMQARLVAQVFSGALALPDPGRMRAVAAADGARYQAQLEHNADRVQTLVDYHIYMDDLAKMIGCLPPFGRLAVLRPRIWLRLVFGPTQGTQFRLRGPGSKPQIARDILRKIPVSRWNHMVRAGLVGRVRVALGRLVRPGVRATAPALAPEKSR